MLESFRTLWPYMRRYRRGLALGMGSLVLKDLAHVAAPLVIRSAIDTLTAGRPFTMILRLALLLAGIALFKGLFQFWMRVILIGISRDVEYDLRNDLFAHLVSLSPDFYARQRTGRHHGARHQRSERGAHDAGTGRHVLDRNQPDVSCLPLPLWPPLTGGLCFWLCCRRPW